MVLVFDCYNRENKPYILDISTQGRGINLVKGQKMFVVNKDKQVEGNVVVKSTKRWQKRGWSLSRCYVVIVFYYTYNRKKGVLDIDMKLYRPFLSILDKVYYIESNQLFNPSYLQKLKKFGKLRVERMLQISSSKEM